MAKGNYTALQQLKPTEIKVGELYNKWVDGYIKNGEAERAAKAKMLAEQKKSAQEMVAKIDPKIFTTLQSFQPQTNDIFNSILENKAILGRMVDSGQMDSNFYNLKAKTDNLASQYLQLSTIVANPQFLEADKKINEQIQEGDIFEGDENMGRWMSIKSGIAQLKANPNTGDIEVIYQNNIKSEDTDKPAKVEKLHEFASNYSSGVSKNLKSDIEEKLKAVSAEASKKINSDGITTYDSKAFNEVTARNTITQLMGLDPNKPVEEQFTNVNNLTPFAKQYFYGNGRLRFPENGEDLKVLVDDAVNFAKGYSNTSYGRVTSQSAADREGQYWDNKNKKKQFYKQDAPSGGSGSSSGGSGGFSSVSDGMINKQDKVIVQIRGNEGQVKGVQLWAANTVPLPKVKGYPATENTFGLSKFTNKKGEEVQTIIMGAPADDGRMVYSKISASDFTANVSKSGYDPYSVLAKLQKENNSYNNYTGQVDSSKKIYNNVKVGYKAKQVSDEEESGSFGVK